MLIPPRQLRRFFLVRPTGVLHVGAHSAQEFSDYHDNAFGRVLWVEAQASLIPGLVEKVCGVGDQVFHAAVWSQSGVVLDLNIANNSQSSSLFEFQDHREFYPEVEFVGREPIETIRLDELIPQDEHFDMTSLDVQGSELEALRGLGNRLQLVRWVYLEVNKSQLYAGIPLVAEIDNFLLTEGFRRVVTVWKSGNWGDALYVRPGSRLEDLYLSVAGRLYEILRVNLVLSMVRSVRLAGKRFFDWLYLRLRNIE